MKSKIKKVIWTSQEDSLITTLVKKYGPRKWSRMAEELYESFGTLKKSGKQCRQRWFNHLDPSIVKNSWSLLEQDIMFQCHKKYGNKWTLIAEELPGRSDNAIKNHFYSIIRKSLRRVNKFFGSKQGTAKVRKIKPTTLSKIFERINEDSRDMIDCFSEEAKSREMAYHLVNFSRVKLSDSKKRIAQEDLERLEMLLQQIEKHRYIISQSASWRIAKELLTGPQKREEDQIWVREAGALRGKARKKREQKIKRYKSNGIN